MQRNQVAKQTREKIINLSSMRLHHNHNEETRN